MREPARGDIFYVDLDEHTNIGSEQCGMRPVIILQNNTGNHFSPTTIIAIITTKMKKTLPTHITFYAPDILPKQSTICAEQVRTIDQSRLLQYCGNVGNEIMKQVNNAVAISMGILQLNAA